MWRIPTRTYNASVEIRFENCRCFLDFVFAHSITHTSHSGKLISMPKQPILDLNLHLLFHIVVFCDFLFTYSIPCVIVWLSNCILRYLKWMKRVDEKQKGQSVVASAAKIHFAYVSRTAYEIQFAAVCQMLCKASAQLLWPQSVRTKQFPEETRQFTMPATEWATDFKVSTHS